MGIVIIASERPKLERTTPGCLEAGAAFVSVVVNYHNQESGDVSVPCRAMCIRSGRY